MPENPGKSSFSQFGGWWGQVDVQCARPAIPRAEKKVTLVGWWGGYTYHTIGPEGVRVRETLLVELFPPPPVNRQRGPRPSPFGFFWGKKKGKKCFWFPVSRNTCGCVLWPLRPISDPRYMEESKKRHERAWNSENVQNQSFWGLLQFLGKIFFRKKCRKMWKLFVWSAQCLFFRLGRSSTVIWTQKGVVSRSITWQNQKKRHERARTSETGEKCKFSWFIF